MLTVALEYHVGSDNLLVLGDLDFLTGPDGLKDVLAGAFLGAGEATITLDGAFDVDGGAISPGLFPISFSFLAGSTGVWTAQIPSTLAVAVDQRFQLRGTATLVADGSVRAIVVEAVGVP